MRKIEKKQKNVELVSSFRWVERCLEIGLIILQIAGLFVISWSKILHTFDSIRDIFTEADIVADVLKVRVFFA